MNSYLTSAKQLSPRNYYNQMAPHESKSNFVYISTLMVILWTMSWLTAIWQAQTSINQFVNSLKEGTTTISKHQIHGARHTNSRTTQTIGPNDNITHYWHHYDTWYKYQNVSITTQTIMKTIPNMVYGYNLIYHLMEYYSSTIHH